MTIETVDFNISIEISQYSHILIEFIKYLLYIRNQIQCPYHNLLQLQLNKSTLSKTEKFIKQCNLMFNSIENEFKITKSVELVSLVFGSSIISPKEIYLFRLPNHTTTTTNIATPNSSQDIQTIMRDIFRTLMISQPNSFIDNLSKTKLFILTCSSRLSDIINNDDDTFNNNNNNNIQVNENEEDINNSFFIPKQNIHSLSIKKSTKITLFDFDSNQPISNIFEIIKNRLIFKCINNISSTKEETDMEVDMDIDNSIDNNDLKEETICFQSPFSILGM